MTFKFSEHQKCLNYEIVGERSPCNADRALVAKEGERLERLVERLIFSRDEMFYAKEDAEKQCERLQQVIDNITRTQQTLARDLEREIDARTRLQAQAENDKAFALKCRSEMIVAAEAETKAKLEAKRLREALESLLDVAERNTAGYTVQTEHWYAVRDNARAALEGK